MKTLHNEKPNNLSMLHDEILAAIPELRPKPDPQGNLLPVMHVEGLGDDIWLTVPDETNEPQVTAVVNAHDPTTWKPPFPTSTHWATISAMNPGAVKPLTTQRHYEGYTYTFDCYVSSEIVELWQAGKLLIGDYVLIEFVEHDINRPVAFVKVQKTW